MRIICPKIFAKLDFFATMSQMGVAFSAVKNFSTFLTFSQLFLAYPGLKVLKNWNKINNIFRIKDKLEVILGHKILIIIYH